MIAKPEWLLKMNIKKRIVAEVSKSWPATDEADPRIIAQLFEKVIAENASRGFELESWRFNAIQPAPSEMIETIIAVFVEVA
jgi:hypothetical protein